MYNIPAQCSVCDLLFAGPIVMDLGSKVDASGSVTNCPRCNKDAFMINGHFEKINEMVIFITSSDHSIEDKRALIETAKNISTGTVSPNKVIKSVEKRNKVAGAILRDWMSLGLNFVGTMAAVAGVVLQFISAGSNLPPEEIAADAFQKRITQGAHLRATYDSDPIALSLSQAQAKAKRGTTQGAHAEPEYENRKARRARIAERRKRQEK